MALYRLKDSPFWWVSIVNPRTGQRIRKSTKLADKAQAKLFEDQLRASLVLGQEHYALQEHHQHTWKEAAERWLKETKTNKSHEQDKARIECLNVYLGQKSLTEVDAALIHRIAETQL